MSCTSQAPSSTNATSAKSISPLCSDMTDLPTVSDIQCRRNHGSANPLERSIRRRPDPLG